MPLEEKCRNLRLIVCRKDGSMVRCVGYEETGETAATPEGKPRCRITAPSIYMYHDLYADKEMTPEELKIYSAHDEEYDMVLVKDDGKEYIEVQNSRRSRVRSN